MRKTGGMKVGAALFLFLLCVAGAIVGEYVLAAPPTQVGLGIDVSPSVERDCAGLAAEAARAISESGIRDGSIVSLLAMGRNAANPEPARLFKAPVPLDADGVFGRDEAAFKASRQKSLENIRKACESAPASKGSPLLRMVERGIADLRSRGCAGKASCFYIIQTDLEDDADPKLRAAIAKAAKDPGAKLPAKLAGSIDNAGIRLEFCGTAEVRAVRSHVHAAPDTLTNLWMGLFAHPELVSFQPYCGR